MAIPTPFRKLSLRRQKPVFARPESELRKRTEAFCAANTLSAQTRRISTLFISIWILPTDRAFTAGLIRWIRLLEQDHPLRERFQQSWQAMIAQLDSVSFFADTGISA